MSTRNDKKATEVTETAEPVTSGPRYKRKAALALPTYSIKDWPQGKPLYVKINGEMVTKEQTNEDGSVRMEKGQPLHLTTINIIDLDTGVEGNMVVPFLIKRAFDEIVTRDGSLSGKCFELIKGRKVNRVNEYSVYEIEE